MPTAFPTALDQFSNPSSNDPTTSATVRHSTQHANANDAIEALQAKVGVDGSAVATSIEYRLADVQVGVAAVEADLVDLSAQADALQVGVAAVEADLVDLSAQADAFDSNADIDGRTVVMARQTTNVVVAAAVTSFSRDLPFCGWGDLFAKNASAPFNAVQIRSLARASVRPYTKWNKIHVFVRVGSTPQTSGTVVAVGSVEVDMESDALTNLLILLKDPSSGQPKTVSLSELTDVFFIGYYARTYNQLNAACGECRGNLANHYAANRYYILHAEANPSAAAWTLSTGSERIAVEQLMLTGAAEFTEGLAVARKANAKLSKVGVLGPLLAPYVYAMEGLECNLYWRNLFGNDSWMYSLHVDATTSPAVGKQQAERFTWTPAAGGANSTLTLDVYNDFSGDLVSTQTATLRYVAASAGSGKNKKILMVGDSLADDITAELLNVASGDVMGLTLLGTQGSGSNKHESRAGWTISNFYYNDPPFRVSGVLNFAQYLTNNSLAVPDWVLVNLGTNDVFSKTSDSAVALDTATSITTWLSLLIANFKLAGPSVKVAIIMPPPPSESQDAFGEDYAAGQSTWRFRRNIWMFCYDLLASFSGQEGSRTYLIPGYAVLDTENNMQVGSSAPVNARSAINVARQSNGVHPHSSGYKQIADQVWAFLKYHHAA